MAVPKKPAPKGKGKPPPFVKKGEKPAAKKAGGKKDAKPKR